MESADIDGWVARMLAEEDPHRWLRIFISWIRVFFENDAPILRAALASNSDPEVAAMAERGDDNRLQGTTQLTNLLSRRGFLRDGLKPIDAAERLWLLTSVKQYLIATGSLGWTPEDDEHRLGDLLERELLQPRRH